MSLFPRYSALLAVWLLAGPLASAASLLKSHPLQGEVKTTCWTFLASQNPYRIPDSPSTMTGTMTVASPGYGASMGLYSWTGAYSMTVNQASTAAPSFGIHQVVYQLDVTWDPATTFPANGGPKLSYNGGNQQIPATLPVIVDGTRVVENETGVPEMGDIEAFTYRGITWQWDLSAIPGTITSVRVEMPFANHTSVVGARIDVASGFAELGGPAATPLEQWRQLHFQTAENAGAAADNADFDSDGLANLVEYGLGTNPASAAGPDGSSAAPVPVMTDGKLSLFFAIPTTPPEALTYEVQVSGDLSGWTTLATKSGSQPWLWNGGGTSQVAMVTAGGKSQVTVGDNGAGPGKRMMRLEITY
jgi:hypothetical protein